MNAASVAIRVVLGGFGLLFVWAATLQFNDPAPGLWVGVYLSAALACLSGAAGIDVPAAVSAGGATGGLFVAAYLGWMIYTGEVTPMYGDRPPEELAWFQLEEGREAGGLLLIAVALSLHAVWAYRRTSRMIPAWSEED